MGLEIEVAEIGPRFRRDLTENHGAPIISSALECGPGHPHAVGHDESCLRPSFTRGCKLPRRREFFDKGKIIKYNAL